MTDQVYKGKVINVSSKQVQLPNGLRIKIDVVEHPGAVLIIPFLNKDKIIFLKQFRPVINAYLYELPAGTLNKDESALACAKREIIEETGYAAGRFTRIGVIYPVPGYSTEKITIFKAQGLRKEKACPEADEIIEAVVVTQKALRQLFRSGKIADAKTICAFAFCGWL